MMDKKLSGPLPGQRMGRLLILDDFIVTPKGERKYRCRCDCGNEKYILERSLRYGGAESCGCPRKENARKALSLDLKGQIFGELTVLHRAENQRKNGGIWWTCQCSCGALYDVPGTLLVTGRRTRCSGKNHAKNYASADITGKRFHRLTALYALPERNGRGSIMWHCRCDCGNEVDVPYNNLVHCNMKSCGCQKKEHDKALSGYLTHVAGTSIEMVKSKKLPSDNTSGCKGVYLIRGKYVAKIVFQKKAYYLGSFAKMEDAVKARQEAERVLFDETAAYYAKWKEKADTDPDWAKENPIQIRVAKDSLWGLKVICSPDLSP